MMRRILTESDYKFCPGEGWMCTGCNPTANGRKRGTISNEGIYRLLDHSQMSNDVNFWLCPPCFEEKIGAKQNGNSR